MENMELKLNEALELINKEDFIGAQAKLSEIIKEQPENIEVLKNLGLCEVNLDNPIAAIEAFLKVVQIDDTDATSRYYLASCYSRVGEKEKAIVEFEKVLELRPDFLEVYKSLAMIYIEFSQIESALALLNKALENENLEFDYSFYYILATTNMLIKDNQKAAEYLTKALELNPQHTGIANSLSVCLMNLGQYEKVETILKSAIEIDNQNSLTYYNLGIYYQTIEDFKNAISSFQMSYQIEPSITMLATLANCALKGQEFELASTLYQNLVMAYPNNSQYRISYVEALEALRNYPVALENLNYVLKVDEKNIDLIKKKGTLLRKLGLNIESIETFNLLLNRGKVDVEVYYNLAFNYVELADFDNAKEMFKKCIILEPNNPYAHKDLGVLYLKMNCYEWAVDEMLEAIELEDDVAEFHYSLGVAYMMLSNMEDAKKSFHKALDIDSSYVDAMAYLGYAYLLEKNYEKTNEYLQKAIEIDPTNFLAKNHLAKYYFEIKKFDIAKQFLLDLTSDIKDDETMNMLAICYMETNDFEDAMGIFSKLVVDYPKNHILLTNLAKCELQCQKITEATEHLRQALMIYSDFDEALKLLEEIK